MSVLLSVHQVVAESVQQVHTLTDMAGIGNPEPKAPPGVKAQASNILGYVKWGALFVIIACGFAGAGALAGGHVLSHQRSSQIGIKILIGTVVAAVVYAAIYTFLTGVTG